MPPSFWKMEQKYSIFVLGTKISHPIGVQGMFLGVQGMFLWERARFLVGVAEYHSGEQTALSSRHKCSNRELRATKSHQGYHLNIPHTQ